MPLNGAGTYNPPGASFPAVVGQIIESNKYNSVINDMAAALSQAFYRDGQAPMTGTMNVGNQLVTNVNGLRNALGSVGNPTYSFMGDLSTGLYSPGAGQIALTANGVNRVLANSTGVAVTGDHSVTGVSTATKLRSVRSRISMAASSSVDAGFPAFPVEFGTWLLLAQLDSVPARPVTEGGAWMISSDTGGGTPWIIEIGPPGIIAFTASTWVGRTLFVNNQVAAIRGATLTLIRTD